MIKTRILYIVIIGIIMTNLFITNSIGDEINLDEVKHVLIINAYHKGFEWTDNMTEAIQNTLAAYDESIIVSVEYLDWKRYPTQENLDYQYQLLKYKYKDEKISLIIGTDDMGMQFAIDYRAELFNDAPIVFTAVFEDSAQVRMAGETNITGVYETTDAIGTIKAIMNIHPNLDNIYIVRDNSESAKGFEDSLESAFLSLGPSASHIVRIPLHDYSFDSIKEILSNPLPNSAVIMGSYNTDINGLKLSDQAFSLELAAVSSAPIYSVYEYLFGYGIVGGSLLSGYLQG